MARTPRSPFRPDWAPSPDEAEALAYAQNTRFNTFVDDVAADPLGRGRPAPLAPVATAPGASAQQIDQAQAEALSKLPPRPYNPELGDTSENMPPPYEVGGAKPGYNPELGDTSENMPPPYAVGGQAQAQARPEIADPFPSGGNPPARQAPPRALAPPKAEVNAGPTPETGSDTFLRNLPGAAAYFAELADWRHGGPNREQRMQGYTDQNMDRNARADAKRDAYGRRKAALERAAEREFQQGQVGADRENYRRDENARTEAKGDQRYEQDRAEDMRRYQTAEQRWQAANSPEAREAARQADLEDYKAKQAIGTDENLRQARELAKMKRGKGGAGRGNVQQAYAGALEALAQKHGGIDKIPPMERQQLDLAAQSKDAIGALRQVTSGYVTRDAAAGAADAKNEVKAKASRDQANATLMEMDRLLETAKGIRSKGQKYVPGKEPLVGDGGLSARYKRGKAMLLGDPERGSTGYTADQALVANGYQLAAQADFHAQTGQTANMAAERERAEAAFSNNNSMDGFIRELEVRRAKLAGALQNGTYVPRDENGNALTMSAPEQAPAPQQGTYTDPDDIR